MQWPVATYLHNDMQWPVSIYLHNKMQWPVSVFSSRIYFTHFHYSCRPPWTWQADQCLWTLDSVPWWCCHHWLPIGRSCLWCHTKLWHPILHGSSILWIIRHYKLHSSNNETLHNSCWSATNYRCFDTHWWGCGRGEWRGKKCHSRNYWDSCISHKSSTNTAPRN